MKLHTHNTLAIASILVALSFLSQKLPAQENDSAELVAIIDAIEKGWEQGDGTPFREHYLDFEGARYVESGG